MPQNFPLDLDDILRVLDYLNVGVYITDLDRRILLWNRKAEEITGYRASQVVGHCCRDNILNHIDKDGHLLCPTHLCPLYRAMATNRESVQPITIFAQKAGGSRVAVSVSVAPLQDEKGNVIGGIEAFHDETANIRDMEFAKRIQRHLLPRALPQAPSLSFDVRYYPHDLIGGDFYDVKDIGDGRYSVFVADVRGHGVSASLYTAVLKTIKESISDRLVDPADFLSALNREISPLVVEESFATAACAVIDTADWQVTVSSAGHPSALHFQAATNSTTLVEAYGLPLGINPDEQYESIRFYLMRGDLLLFYSDGITDVRDADDKMLSTEGLARLLREEILKGEDDLLERIYKAALTINADVAFADDALLLSAKRTQ